MKTEQDQHCETLDEITALLAIAVERSDLIAKYKRAIRAAKKALQQSKY